VTLRELWRRPVGSGFSGIAVSGGRGFTGESDGTTDHAIAFDVETGRTVWRAPLGETHRGHDGSRDGPIATPAVGDGRVFMAGPRGLLVALDAASGRELWRHDLPKDLQAKLPFYGFGASPVLVGERLVLHVGGTEKSGLVAFDASTGRVAWSTQPAETKGDSTGYSMAAPAEIDGEPQLLALGHDRVFAVRAGDGSVAWSHPLPEPEEPTRAPLALPDSRVLVSRFADTTLLKLGREEGAWKAAEVWRSPRLKNTYSPSVHRGGYLFGFGGQYLLCVDPASGEPRWRHKVNSGSLIAVGRHLVVLGELSGLLRVVEATPDGYRQAAEAAVFNAGAQSSTGPSYADGRIFVRNVEEMVALALEGGAPQARR
jgi:outer membrane protein assembly factor BamB